MKRAERVEAEGGVLGDESHTSQSALFQDYCCCCT